MQHDFEIISLKATLKASSSDGEKTLRMPLASVVVVMTSLEFTDLSTL